MIKIIAKFESIVSEKTGHFLLDQDTPIPVAKEMCLQFLKYLGQLEDQVKAQAEAAAAAKEAEAPKVESIEAPKVE